MKAKDYYMLDTTKIFSCLMKSREEMQKDIPENLLGWWHDIFPGKVVKLRQATAEDMKRSWVRSFAPKNAEAYMVEPHERGCLILKDAIKSFVGEEQKTLSSDEVKTGLQMLREHLLGGDPE